MPHGTGGNSSHSSVSERRDVEVGEREPKPSKFARKASSAWNMPQCSQKAQSSRINVDKIWDYFVKIFNCKLG
jgi:hypothetical protein